MTAPTKAQKQLQRRIDKQLDSEARWLQKMLFALGKSIDARDKLAEITGDAPETIIVMEDGTEVDLKSLAESVQTRVDQLMDALGTSQYGRRA